MNEKPNKNPFDAVISKAVAQQEASLLRQDGQLGPVMQTVKHTPVINATCYDNGLTKIKVLDDVAGLNVKSRF